VTEKIGNPHSSTVISAACIPSAMIVPGLETSPVIPPPIPSAAAPPRLRIGMPPSKYWKRSWSSAENVTADAPESKIPNETLDVLVDPFELNPWIVMIWSPNWSIAGSSWIVMLPVITQRGSSCSR